METGGGGLGVGVVSTGTASSLSWAPFLGKTYDMVDDPATDGVVSWSKGNDSFVVWSVPEFSRDLLPKYFKHSNFSSFVRQLNTYGFRKIDPDRQEFANEWFIRGQKHLLKSIYRRKASQVQNPSVSLGIEDGTFGMDEEVEMLKKDKNILMQELIRLRQQQQSTDNQLQNVGQRVHLMENRQKHMMSFLSKAMQKPGFVAQLMQQQNDTNLHISGGNKKRRIPSQNEEILSKNLSVASLDGQIVKYKPLMNEAAMAMSTQILNMSSSSRLESKYINANGFLIGNGSPHSVSDAGSSSDRMSLVALSEVNSNSLRTEPCSSTGFLNQELVGMLFPETKAQDFTHVRAVNLQKNIEGVEAAYLEHGNIVDGFVDAPVPVASGDLLVDAMIDDVPTLPGIHDVFWEQFLPGNVQPDEQDMEHQELEWGKLKSLNTLAEQMRLLASVSNSG